MRNGAVSGWREHVVAHACVRPGEWAQFLDPVRVGQEPAVEDEVDVDRQTVLVAERHDARLERAGTAVAVEQLAQPVAQLVDVELAGVEHDVGTALELTEELTLVGDALGHAFIGRQRVLAAALLVPAHQHVVGGVEEQHAGARAHPPQLGERGHEVVDELARAHVDHEAELLGTLGALPELGDLDDERGRQVVDHEEAEILEHVGRGRPPRTRHAGDDGDVEGHVAARSP